MKTGSLAATIKGWRNNYPFLVIVALIAIQIIGFYIIYWMPYMENNVFGPLVHFYAVVSSKILNLFGYQTSVSGDIIFSMWFTVGIKKGCDALEPMALLVAGIIAFPATLRQKLLGLFSGLAFLFVLNIVRIGSLFITGVYRPDLFEAMHIEIWQIIFILFGIGFWFLWIRWAVRTANVQ